MNGTHDTRRSGGDPAIRTDGLTKRYGDTTAVQDLDLRIAPGTVYGFLGPNGAGKSTTIEMLTTLTPPTAGTASIAGASIRDRDAVKRRIGYLPEELPLYEEFTAYEQLTYVADLRRMDPDLAEDRITTLLDRVGLAGDADARIDTYSQGMRQKVGLLQAILHEPQVVFLDEPTRGLDPRAARVATDLVADLAGQGTTVFLSSHILPVVEELADTVGVLHHGRLVAEDSPDRLTRQADDGSGGLEEVFLEVTTEPERPREASETP